jgi:hypothetical protein
MDGTPTISAWIPLCDCPLEMGPMMFAVGSHRLAPQGTGLQAIRISDESESAVWEHVRRENCPVVTEAMQLGDVSFHHGAEKRFLGAVCIEKRIFYQDRLGTNIGKVEQTGRFIWILQAGRCTAPIRTAARSVVRLTRSSTLRTRCVGRRRRLRAPLDSAAPARQGE